MIYMDNGAAEKPSDAAILAAEHVLMKNWANPNSVHSFGMKAAQEVSEAREKIAVLMDCEPDEVHFCSCACEAASWAVKSMAKTCGRIVCRATEHSCVLDAVNHIQPFVDPDKNRTGICSMLANNETGEIYNTPKGNVLRFVDATAAVGHIPVSFRSLDCDYLCADAIKFGGIPGAAFLIAKRKAPLIPIIYGKSERGGTPAAALIVAMAAALQESYCRMPEKISKTVAMRDYMIRSLVKIPGTHLNGKWTEGSIKDRLPGNINISFENVDGTSLGLILSKNGLMVSSGAACSSGNNAPSHVLLAMGVPTDLAKGTIRITLNDDNTIYECETAVNMIAEAVEHLRSLVF